MKFMFLFFLLNITMIKYKCIIKEGQSMIKREFYMKQIRPFIDQDIIKIITGMRRSGKSVMLDLIKEELKDKGITDNNTISFNFESMSNAAFCTSESLYEEINKRIKDIDGKVYLFFDEIQEVKNWEKVINSAIVDFDCDIYITGSNARLLSGELATYLGGRYIEITIYPFSFAEYLESRKESDNDININREFNSYVELGGMPFLTNLDSKDAKLLYLNDIYNSVVLKDVVKRNSIRDVDLLDRVYDYIIANVGHMFSANSISTYLKSKNRKVAPYTILNHIKAGCDAFLFYKISREDLAGKKILTVNEKYYIVDQGIREAIYGNNTKDIDQILENIVGMEIIRRGYDVTVGKTQNGEIDFVAKKNKEKLYIQVIYLLQSQETIDREFNSYKHIDDNYPKYVVSMDEFDMSRNGIKHMNIRDFLLADEWN